MDAQRSAPNGEVCPCCEKPDCEAHRSHVRMLEQRIAVLEEQNTRLAQSANAFGNLAERLSERLGERRQRGADRRERDRACPDRRARHPGGQGAGQGVPHLDGSELSSTQPESNENTTT